MLFILLVYLQVINYDFVNFDDYDYVKQNPYVSGGITLSSIKWAFTSLYAFNWHPITWLSHMADINMYGLNPHGHHLTSVIIHILSTFILITFLLRLTGAFWKCLFVGALFGLHPLHVESVAWIAERKDVLSALFWFLTLFLYAEYVLKQRKILYLFALFTYALGLMSKPMLVTLPVILHLLDIWPLDRYNKQRKEQIIGYSHVNIAKLIYEKLPFWAFSLLSVIITVYAQQKGGAVADLSKYPLLFRLENAFIAYIKYIGMTFWPVDLTVFYPYPTSIELWQSLSSLLVVTVLSFMVIRYRNKYCYLFFGWFWFLITLLPVIGLIQVGNQAMADRYMYIPITGLLIIIAWGGQDICRYLNINKYVVMFISSSVVVVSAVVTYHQIGVWRNSICLFKNAVESSTSPNQAMRLNLGRAYLDNNDLDAAINELSMVISLDPQNKSGHFWIGNAYAKQNNLDAAIREFSFLVSLDGNDIIAHRYLGFALGKKGNIDASIHEFKEVLRLDPNNIMGHLGLGLAYYDKGDKNSAIKEMQEVLSRDPNNIQASKALQLINNERKALVEPRPDGR